MTIEGIVNMIWEWLTVNGLDLAQTIAIIVSLCFTAKAYRESNKWKERPQVISLMKNVLAVIENMLKNTNESCYYKVYSYLREQINGSSLNLLVTRFLNKRWWKKLESQLKSLEELYKDLEKEYNNVLKTLKQEINLKGLKNDPQIISIVMKIYSSEYEEGLKKLASDLMEHRIKGLYPSYNEIWRRLSAKYDDEIKAIRDRRKNIQEFAKNIKENIKKEMERLIERYKLTPEEFEEDARKKWKELRDRYEYYIGYSEQRGEYRLISRGAITTA